MTQPVLLHPDHIPSEVARLSAVLNQTRNAIRQVIFGQDQVIDLMLTGLLAGGHLLLVGLPGLAKTRLVTVMAGVLDLTTQRIQCTPDLMPSDILGAEVLDQDSDGRRHFRFIPGPIFSHLLMADEINRASPRTQSALLQAMQEQQISVGGTTHALPKPFHVLATQNPLEQEGTYPLPEAQLDRFLMQIDVGYPNRDAERAMLLATTGLDQSDPGVILGRNDLAIAQYLVRALPVSEQVLEGILTLVRAGRPTETSLDRIRELVIWGPGPRAGQALVMACRARALLDGRLAPSLDDVVALAKPVLHHRMALHYGARADGITLDHLIDLTLEQLV